MLAKGKDYSPEWWFNGDLPSKNYLQQTKGDDCVPPPLPKSDGLLELKINWVGASAKAFDDIADTSYFLTEKQ